MYWFQNGGKKSKLNDPLKFKVDNLEISVSSIVSNIFNKYYSNVGTKMAKEMKVNNRKYRK